MGERTRHSSSARSTRAKKRRQRTHYRQNRMGMLCISGIVFVLLMALSTQIVKLNEKDKAYQVEEQELQERLAEEEERQEEIKAYKEYMNTTEFVEQVAKSKIGLVYPNEIVFREKGQ